MVVKGGIILDNFEYIYSELCKLYEQYKQNPNIEIRCYIDVAGNKYAGSLVFDSNLVIPNESIILEGVFISNKDGVQISKYDFSTINMKAIDAFSYYKINSSSND